MIMTFLGTAIILLVLAVVGVCLLKSGAHALLRKPEEKQLDKLNRRRRALRVSIYDNTQLWMRADDAGKMRLEAVQGILRAEYADVNKQIQELEIEKAEREALEE